jgi:hypothetical protein
VATFDAWIGSSDGVSGWEDGRVLNTIINIPSRAGTFLVLTFLLSLS